MSFLKKKPTKLNSKVIHPGEDPAKARSKIPKDKALGQPKRTEIPADSVIPEPKVKPATIENSPKDLPVPAMPAGSTKADLAVKQPKSKKKKYKRRKLFPKKRQKTTKQPVNPVKTTAQEPAQEPAPSLPSIDLKTPEIPPAPSAKPATAASDKVEPPAVNTPAAVASAAPEPVAAVPFTSPVVKTSKPLSVPVVGAQTQPAITQATPVPKPMAVPVKPVVKEVPVPSPIPTPAEAPALPPPVIPPPKPRPKPIINLPSTPPPVEVKQPVKPKKSKLFSKKKSADKQVPKTATLPPTAPVIAAIAPVPMASNSSKSKNTPIPKASKSKHVPIAPEGFEMYSHSGVQRSKSRRGKQVRIFIWLVILAAIATMGALFGPRIYKLITDKPSVHYEDMFSNLLQTDSLNYQSHQRSTFGLNVIKGGVDVSSFLSPKSQFEATIAASDNGVSVDAVIEIVANDQNSVYANIKSLSVSGQGVLLDLISAEFVTNKWVEVPAGYIAPDGDLALSLLASLASGFNNPYSLLPAGSLDKLTADEHAAKLVKDVYSTDQTCADELFEGKKAVRCDVKLNVDNLKQFYMSASGSDFDEALFIPERYPSEFILVIDRATDLPLELVVRGQDTAESALIFEGFEDTDELVVPVGALTIEQFQVFTAQFEASQ